MKLNARLEIKKEFRDKAKSCAEIVRSKSIEQRKEFRIWTQSVCRVATFLDTMNREQSLETLWWRDARFHQLRASSFAR